MKHSKKLGVERRPLSQSEFDPQIDYRTPVLLHQGFGAAAAAAGDIGRSENQVSTGRGTVKYLDLYPFFFSAALFDADIPVTISAGGQVLLEDSNLGIWNFDTQLGKDKRHRVRVKLNDAQTFETVVDNTNGILIQAVFPQLYYTTPSYEHFIKNEFRLNWDLGLKRRTYRLELPDGAPLDNSAFIERVLPRNNGNIIAIGVHCSSAVTDLRNIFYNVAIDGIEMIKEVVGLNAATANGRDGYILPAPIRPGATMNFSATGDLTVAGDPVVLFVTFYFSR